VKREKNEQVVVPHDHTGGGLREIAPSPGSSGPQAKLLEGTPGHLLVLLFGASFLHDQGHIAIKGELLPLQPASEEPA
jgi:hypothetical protein